MACKVSKIYEDLTKLHKRTAEYIKNSDLAVEIIRVRAKRVRANDEIVNKWAESVLNKATKQDVIVNMKTVGLSTELQEVDTSRIVTEMAPWDVPKGNNVWGQRVSTTQAKSLTGYSPVLNFGNPFMTGDYANTPLEYNTAEGSNGLATAQYYFWLTEGTIPGTYKGDTKLLDERRNWILNNLALVNNADSIAYKGTAAGKQINHVTALIKVAEDKLGKVERVKTPKTPSKAPAAGTTPVKPAESKGVQTYEVSTKGDKRFSALVAKLKDGRTIEEAFQLDVKGYRSKGNDWRLGKGKPPLDKSLNLQDEYTKLWQQFFTENPGLFAEISGIVESGTWLTDQFAGKGVNQADTIAGIVNSNWTPDTASIRSVTAKLQSNKYPAALTCNGSACTQVSRQIESILRGIKGVDNVTTYATGALQDTGNNTTKVGDHETTLFTLNGEVYIADILQKEYMLYDKSNGGITIKEGFTVNNVKPQVFKYTDFVKVYGTKDNLVNSYAPGKEFTEEQIGSPEKRAIFKILYANPSKYLTQFIPLLENTEKELRDSKVPLKKKGHARAVKLIKTLKELNTLSDTPEFDKLPSYVEGQNNMVYAGIGSRETPIDIQQQMNEAAKYLEDNGYKLRSGAALGADKAFEGAPQPWAKDGDKVTQWSTYAHKVKASNKEVYKSNAATDTTRAIAREIHESNNLKDGFAVDMHARNTNQIFGADLNTVVDFVLAWTPLNDKGEVVTHADQRYYGGKGNSNNTGGTGQAIAYASLKGVPVINMADNDWRAQLDAVIEKTAEDTSELDELQRLVTNAEYDLSKAGSKEEVEFATAELTITKNRLSRALGVTVADKNWTRASAEADSNNVYIFGDNTADRKSGYVPKYLTQAVIRGLPNAFGIDTKKSRPEQFTDADYDIYVEYLDDVFKTLEDMRAQGHTFVVSKDGIGTGKADLPPRLHNEMAKRFNAFVRQDLVPEKVDESQVPWNDDSVAEPMVVEKEGRRKVGKVTTVSGEIIEIWKVPTEELTKPDGTELAAIYNSSAKTGGQAAIYLNDSKELWDDYFTNKNWTNPRVQKDGSAAKAIREDAFNSIKELHDFVIQHEIAHNTLGKRTKDKTIGEYETEVNEEAARVLGIELYIEDTTPPFDVDEVVTEPEKVVDEPPLSDKDTERYTLQSKFLANPGQRAVIDSTVDFVTSDKEGIENNVIVIQGKGGTGKSTTIGRAIELANSEGSDKVTMVGMTFTHAAKGVLKDMTKTMKGLNTDVGTFASQLGLLGFSTIKVTRDKGDITTHTALFGKNKDGRPPKIMQTIAKTIDSFAGTNKLVIVVDESSMMTNKDYEMLMDLTDMYEGKFKVIMMGDYHQLAPINGDAGHKTPLGYNPFKLSPSSLITLGAPSSGSQWLADLEKQIPVYSLTEQQRQSVDSSLYKAITMASNKVDSELGLPIENVGEITADGSVEFITTPKLPKVVQTLFSGDNYNNSKYINFNNKNVASFNHKVRPVIFEEDATQEYVAGSEQVILYDNGDTQQEYTNGRQFVVEAVEDTTSNKKFSVEDNTIIFAYKKDVPLVELTLKDGNKRFYITVPKGLTERVINIVRGVEKYTPTIMKANGQPRQAATDVKGVYTQLLLEYMYIEKLGKAKQYSKGDRAIKDETIEELLAIDNLFVPFTYAYGITTYKSQGQTIQNVLYDADNNVFGGKFGSATEMYTGLSRAKSKLYFIGDKSLLGIEKQPVSPTEILNDVSSFDDIDTGAWGSGYDIYEDDRAIIGDFDVPVNTNNQEQLQTSSDFDSVKKYPDLSNAITSRLQQMYPEIKATELATVYDTNGNEVLGRAINGAVEYASNRALDTLPHEYAHVYVDLLENTTFVNNLISKVSKDKGISRKEAKEVIVTAMGQQYVELMKGNDIKVEVSKPLLTKLWDIIINVFTNKDLSNTADNITILSERFYNGQNKDAIRTTPKEGFSKVDTELTFKEQPFAADVLKTIMKKGKGTVQFTGSAALALQGDIYRKGEDGITDLHDLDFAVTDKKVMEALNGELWRNYNIKGIYDFTVQQVIGKGAEEKQVKSYIVVDKKYKITDLHYQGARVQRYKLKDSNGKIVGTYNATIELGKLKSESTTGVKAVIVDLLEDDTKPKGVAYDSPTLGVTIELSAPYTTFDAKNSMGSVPRDKDVQDFNTFYNTGVPSHGTEIAKKYKGKLVLANSGSGKSYASSINDNVIDSDTLLADILGVSTPDIVTGLDAFGADKAYKELAAAIKKELNKGNTVVSPSTHKYITDMASHVIVQPDVYVVQKRASEATRENPISRSLNSVRASLKLFTDNTKGIPSIELSAAQTVSDVLFYKPGIIADTNALPMEGVQAQTDPRCG